MSVDQAAAMDGIVDAVMALLLAGINSDPARIPVEAASLVRGDRANTAPQTPALWVWEVDATPSLNETFRERWVFRLMLVAVVTMTEPAANRTQAVSILSKAMTELARNRRLGLAYVQDLKKGPVRFQPARAPDSNKGLFAVSGEINVEYNITEGVV